MPYQFVEFQTAIKLRAGGHLSQQHTDRNLTLMHCYLWSKGSKMEQQLGLYCSKLYSSYVWFSIQLQSCLLTFTFTFYSTLAQHTVVNSSRRELSFCYHLICTLGKRLYAQSRHSQVLPVKRKAVFMLCTNYDQDFLVMSS